jgi:fucose 4-O-acetylase-like acetyltransferase
MLTNSYKREISIDIAKGIAIVAIVIGHVNRGLFDSGMFSNVVLYEFIDRVLYSTHLSVFAFISGLFVQSGLNKYGGKVYIENRFMLFVWLYLLWTFLQASANYLMTRFVINPVDVRSVYMVWKPYAHFWFLPWLLVATSICVILKPWLSTRRTLITLIPAVIISIISWGYQGVYVGTQGVALLAIFLFGGQFGNQRFSKINRFPISVLALIVIVFIVISITVAYPTPTTGYERRNFMTLIIGFVATGLGTISVIQFSILLSAYKSGVLISNIGRYSLEIFIAHVFFTAGTRVLLARVFNIEIIIVQLFIGSLLGVFGPIAVAVVAKCLKLNFLFTSPIKIVHHIK